ncbi:MULTISPECIES: ferritin-like domain-containing protein [unclassified Caballeronia]|uniref:ferritin-like domain-containing protein n=1 Tax=unclassified Caballeronia TaxID=2646786 RepID=UPI002857AD59|nr:MULTISPECIES: ferritin-like domain-containing protein [unclassified Caballeronia]MDR5812910.1 ferritin-like domain-containing protein [Caballeronia sp. LZ033]MDR5819762.1 ferritin-like domain-containing protein [Caballeronia sp. LZ043]MDR5877532.1 ferritin-like domain-containing protein [Caballeronia sp. LZ032]
MSKSSAVKAAPQASSDPFVLDLDKIRADARQHMDEGPVTASYGADRETVLKLLNDSLATEIVCVLRYKRHYFMAKGIHSEAVAQEFLEHANEEQEHADTLAERIVQLGGEPNFAPDGLASRSHSQYSEGKDLIDMIRENLIAERIAIDTYREIIRYLGDKDVTTRRLFEDILAVEEEHADDMADLLEGRNG